MKFTKKITNCYKFNIEVGIECFSDRLMSYASYTVYTCTLRTEIDLRSCKKSQTLWNISLFINLSIKKRNCKLVEIYNLQKNICKICEISFQEGDEGMLEIVNTSEISLSSLAKIWSAQTTKNGPVLSVWGTPYPVLSSFVPGPRESLHHVAGRSGGHLMSKHYPISIRSPSASTGRPVSGEMSGSCLL